MSWNSSISLRQLKIRLQQANHNGHQNIYLVCMMITSEKSMLWHKEWFFKKGNRWRRSSCNHCVKCINSVKNTLLKGGGGCCRPHLFYVMHKCMYLMLSLKWNICYDNVSSIPNSKHIMKYLYLALMIWRYICI